MRDKFLFPAVLCAFLFVLVSCKQNELQLALFVPKDATSVIVVDTKAITDKINSSGITLDSLANLFNKNQSGLHWSDIENSGVNLDKPCFIFSRELNSMQTGKTSSTGFIAEVKDKSKLENFLKKQADNATAKSDNKYQYLDLGNGFVAGWNDEVLIISGVITGTNKNADETQSHQQLTTLFTQTKSNSVVSADGFDDMLDKKGDIRFWSDASGKLTSLPMMGMTKIGDLFQGTYTTGSIDFEDGKIVASASSNINKTLSDMLNKYPSKDIDKDMITKFPGDVSGFGIVAFNPKVLVDILHYLGFDMMANGYVSQMGFSMDDVMNAFSGDIAFITSNLFIKQHNLPGINNLNTAEKGKYLLVMRIGDKTAFDKVMTGLVNKNLLSKNGDEYQLGMFDGHDFVIETTGSELLVGSSDELIKSYQAGNGKSNLPGDVEKEIDNKSMALYVDINAILKNSDTNDTTGGKALMLAQSTFKNLIASSDKSNGKTIQGNFTLNFVNTNENSLASLAKFIAVARTEELRRENNNAFAPKSQLPNADTTKDDDNPNN